MIHLDEEKNHFRLSFRIPKPPRWIWRLLLDVIVGVLVYLIVGFIMDEPPAEPEIIYSEDCPPCSANTKPGKLVDWAIGLGED